MHINQHHQTAPRHGGDLDRAIAQYGGHAADWLDLSTGISPWSYPIPKLEESLWKNLPCTTNNLLSTAANYYGCKQANIAAVPGSQIAIRLLPTLIQASASVAIPTTGYQEHAYSWQKSGHSIVRYRTIEELKTLVKKNSVTHAVVINPNNPSCDSYKPAQLSQIAKQLSGILVVDEAFSDFDNTVSLCRANGLNNTIILRSLGKFFGLAGARVGFVISQHPVGHELAKIFSPWPLNAAAQRIAEIALSDQTWQTAQINRISQQAIRLSALLELELETWEVPYTLCNSGLFTTIVSDGEALNNLHVNLARKKVWTRLGDTQSDRQNWLRLSLPGSKFNMLSLALDQHF